MFNSLTTEKTLRISIWLAIVSLMILASAPLMAETTRSAKSITFSASTGPGKAEKDAMLQQTASDEEPALLIEGYREETGDSVLAVSMARYSAHEITLYDASTELISDFNNDGFFHRFSVTIDADTIYESAYIYAELYLSYEGGPWNHYASSDSFHIHGDSAQDLYTIETELADGFMPGYYDIRIEIYDGDYHSRILSYGPYDNPSLSALPLEDSYYDDYSHAITPVSTEVIITGDAHGHGSMGLWMLSLPVLLILLRISGQRSSRTEARTAIG